ncbi:MAG: M48 family metalloprotease [Anaerolineae bacterium]|nr:M48 family metalloprotease [Anaerolineae bacterium]
MGNLKWLLALLAAVMSLCSYCATTVHNPITDEDQRVALSVEQEIALGEASAPQIASEYGGMLPNREIQAIVDSVGDRLVDRSVVRQTNYKFEFTVLAENEVINAFALPGGPIFITRALFDRLETEDQLAGVLSHEIGHVVARHAAEQLAKAQLTEGLAGAAVIAAYDPEDPQSGRQTAAISQIVGQIVNMRYGRVDELESDQLGVRFMIEADYDPYAMIEVMEILDESGPGLRPPEFFSTHPNSSNRIEKIQEAIEAQTSDGVPAAELTKE